MVLSSGDYIVASVDNLTNVGDIDSILNTHTSSMTGFV